MEELTIYTDGSCLINPGGPGRYAAIILSGNRELQRLTGSDPSTTCNRMEMMGVIAGLEAIRYSSCLTIYSDSQLVINCDTGRWKRKKNLDLWKRMDAAALRHRVKWRWVKGHNGNRWNELADWLCGTAARQDDDLAEMRQEWRKRLGRGSRRSRERATDRGIKCLSIL